MRHKDRYKGGPRTIFDEPKEASKQPVEAIGAGREEGGSFLLMKRGLYYRPNAQGYTGIKDYAGRYTAKEAADHSDPISGVTAIAETEAPEFSPQCYDDQARAHLSKKLAEAEAKIAALSPASPARTPMGGEVEAAEKAINDWLYEMEGYGYRAERLTEDIRMSGPSIERIKKWLVAAYNLALAASPQPEEVEALREAVEKIASEEEPELGNGNTNDLLARQFWTIATEALAAPTDEVGK